MKSKAATYLLIAGVMVIWGIILWKVFSPGEDAPGPPPQQARAAVEQTAADTLLLNYRDPFLGTVAPPPAAPRRVATVPAAPQSRIASPTPPPPPPVMHRLRYLGTIMREGEPYGLVEINGTLHTMRRGEAADAYRLDAVWRDSVALGWNGETLVVRTGR